MKTVNIKGVGTVNFPDNMDDAAITRAIETEILPQANRVPPPSQNAFAPEVAGVFGGEPAPSGFNWGEVGRRGSKAALEAGTGLGMFAAGAPAVALNPLLAFPLAGLSGAAAGQVGQLYEEATTPQAPVKTLSERMVDVGTDFALSAPFGAADYLGAKAGTPFLPGEIPRLGQAAREAKAARVASFQERAGPGIYVGVGETRPLTPVGQMMWKSPRLQKLADWTRRAADTLTGRMGFAPGAGEDAAGNILSDLKDVVLDVATPTIQAPNTLSVVVENQGLKINPRGDAGLQSLNRILAKIRSAAIDVPQGERPQVDTDALMDLYRFTRSTGKWDKLTTEEQRYFQQLSDAAFTDLGQMDDLAARAFENSVEFVSQNNAARRLQEIMDWASQTIRGPKGQEVKIFNPRRFVNAIDEADGLLKPYARRSGQPAKPNLLDEGQQKVLKQFRDDMALLADDMDAYAKMVRSGEMAPGGFMEQLSAGKAVTLGGLTFVPGSKWFLPLAGFDAGMSYFLTNPSSKALAAGRTAKKGLGSVVEAIKYPAAVEAK